MILIAHRGNLNGPNPDKENHPDYIKEALNKGFNVEVDVWNIELQWFFGHDKPQYKIDSLEFLLNSKIWVHAKNGEAFHKLINFTHIHTFYHTNEDWVLTSKKYIWTYPGKQLFDDSVCVLPELGFSGNVSKCSAICSDYVATWQTAGYHE